MPTMKRLLETMRRLRAPGGCPWDQAQTHESLRPYLLEEAAEAVDAMATDDAAHLAEELGDVLLQVAFHAVIGEEAGRFGYADVEDAIVEKLVRRHPHVFGDVAVADADEVLRNWQAIKAVERGGAPRSPADRVPRSLPALRRAADLGAALEWRAAPDLGRRSFADVAADPDALGPALLALAQAAADAGLDPELVLRDHVEARARGAVAPDA
jgi:XTP/dITP diphosphohydrolase